MDSLGNNNEIMQQNNNPYANLQGVGNDNMMDNQQNISGSMNHMNAYGGSDGERIDMDDISGKIFIGGLSWQTTEDNLRFYFEKYGELSDVALMMDKKTGKPR